jgi:hypothetical protein
MEGRKHTRFAVQLPVSFKGGEFSHRGTILNLSGEGCAITSDTIADKAIYLQLAIQLRDQETPVQVDLAADRWVSSTRFGVEFIKMSSQEEERLKKFVRALESPR